MSKANSTDGDGPYVLRPLRRKEIEEHRVLDEAVLYIPSRKSAFSLNGSAQAVWELCDGSRTADEIVETLSERFGCSEDALGADVQQALQQFRDADLLEAEAIGASAEE